MRATFELIHLKRKWQLSERTPKATANDRDESMWKRHSFTYCIRCVQWYKHSLLLTHTRALTPIEMDVQMCMHYTFIRRILWFIGKQQATINSITKKRTKHHKTGVHVYVCVCVFVCVYVSVCSLVWLVFVYMIVSMCALMTLHQFGFFYYA